jgi:hypothetical protein
MVAESGPMVMAMGSGIRLVAILAFSIILLGFALFAVDEMDRGSQKQLNALGSEPRGEREPSGVIAPSAKEELLREHRNGDIHEIVDDANDILLAPFADLIDSTNAWVRNGVPALLGLLIYGFLLGMVANMLPKRNEQRGDWRAA